MHIAVPGGRTWHVTIRHGGGSPEHYHHFLLGFLVPLVYHFATDWASADVVRVLVRSCGPLDRLIQEFGDPRIQIVAKERHLDMRQRGRCDDGSEMCRFVTIQGCDYPALYDQARFTTVRDTLASKAVTRAARQQWEQRWPHERPRVLLIQRGVSLPFYHSAEAENKESGSDRRSIANHDELSAALRLAFPGCLNVLTEKLSLADQIALFSMADVIIAQHGAALANIIWARPTATVIEIFPRTARNDQKAHDFFRHLAWCTGLRYHKLWQEADHSPVGTATLVDRVARAARPAARGGAGARRWSFRMLQPMLPAVYRLRYQRLRIGQRIQRRLSRQ